MTNLAQLEAYTRELSTAIKRLATHCQNAKVAVDSMRGGPPQLIPPGAPEEAHRARESALASITKLQIMLAGPTDFLQQMASQTQLLACVQWLGEFQVPACVPLDGSALMKDVSDLIGVPETQLCRIIRMATTAGFLQEPQPGYIAHSALSASFVTKPSYLDAAMFLAGTAVPAALEMAAATKQRSGSSERANVVSNNSAFSSSGETQLPRLQLQLNPACALSSSRNGTAASKFDKTQHPRSNPRINVQYRVPGTPQPILDAAVYIINFPLPAPGVSSSTSLATQINAELRAHLNALRMSRSATMVLTVPSLSERGTVSTEAAVQTRIRDLSLMQLANERELEMSELMNLLNGVSDSEGRLVLVNKVRSAGNNGAVALEVKYQAYTDR
ncbi:Uncharacterized protein T310_8038 [Rasamsonia emersonii CBS 393.64]|uniref:Uncharacterized protein n=1 Tax=Rasamsonia emersonii (strain ATCC 16479 / CBS 393.64 / IMI 116815) TaxID=1408163 RepID=A0A0F4YK80_RASE3|nr:Uncharacterized protein T310_8038 [Rasamsonia emersonii CBS 393.64]KKA18013.1 Uncharacterized protein T310_8038 [Rasamsonia emersonii CBS 393.64]